jgi:hypothetical protein
MEYYDSVIKFIPLSFDFFYLLRTNQFRHVAAGNTGMSPHPARRLHVGASGSLQCTVLKL